MAKGMIKYWQIVAIIGMMREGNLNKSIIEERGMHMDRIDFYDAIFHRKSIRKYKMQGI